MALCLRMVSYASDANLEKHSKCARPVSEFPGDQLAHLQDQKEEPPPPLVN